MIPLLVNMYPQHVLSPTVIKTTLGMLPSSLTSLVTTPQWGLYYGLLTIMIPCGLKISYAFVTTPPAQFAQYNVYPKESAAKLRATDKIFARLAGMEENHFENAVFFFAGGLAAIQAGVDKEVITELQTFWIFARFVHMASYLSAGSLGVGVGLLRTVSYIFAAAASASMVLLAAQASS